MILTLLLFGVALFIFGMCVGTIWMGIKINQAGYEVLYDLDTRRLVVRELIEEA